MHVGVDTHMQRHVLLAVDARGQHCDTQSVANMPAGWSCTPRIRFAAALAGIAPVAVSSGDRNGHPLNRGGNRRLNRTFPMIAVWQLRCEPLA